MDSSYSCPELKTDRYSSQISFTMYGFNFTNSIREYGWFLHFRTFRTVLIRCTGVWSRRWEVGNLTLHSLQVIPLPFGIDDTSMWCHRTCCLTLILLALCCCNMFHVKLTLRCCWVSDVAIHLRYHSTCGKIRDNYWILD